MISFPLATKSNTITGTTNIKIAVSKPPRRRYPSRRSSPALADEGERGPNARVRPSLRHVGGKEREHGPAQRLRLAELGIALDLRERTGGDEHRSAALHRPVRHQQRARSGVEERPRQTRKRLRPRLLP